MIKVWEPNRLFSYDIQADILDEIGKRLFGCIGSFVDRGSKIEKEIWPIFIYMQSKDYFPKDCQSTWYVLLASDYPTLTSVTTISSQDANYRQTNALIPL